MKQSPDIVRRHFDPGQPTGEHHLITYGTNKVCWAYVYIDKAHSGEIEELCDDNGYLASDELPRFVEPIEQGDGSKPPVEVQKRLYKERGITPLDDIKVHFRGQPRI